MMYRTRKGGTSRIRAALPMLGIGAVVLGGAVIFALLLRSFRARHEVEGAGKEEVVAGDISEDALMELPQTRSFVVGGQDRGTVTRTVREGHVVLDALLRLDPLADGTRAYHVWLSDEGLAHVVHMGTLFLRADGLFGGSFEGGPEVGILHAETFTRMFLVEDAITLPDEAPRGTLLGELRWE